ncbi:porin [Amorphus sp. MBR-141]
MAATLSTGGAAIAADLPAEPLAVSYVGVCSAAGEGYYTVPGTSTCIHVHGRVRAEYQGYLISGDTGSPDRDLSSTNWLSRAYIHLDSWSETEFGPMTTAFKAYWTNDNFDNAALSVDYAQIDFAGFTFGRTQSFYDAANYLTWADVFTPGQSDLKTQLAAYTASLPGGLSLTASVEAADDRRLGISLYPYSGAPAPAYVTPGDVGYGPGGDGYGGVKWPDAVARLKLDQAWGSAQVMGAAHQVIAAYNDSPGSDGVTPTGGVGWAAGAGLTAKLPFQMTFVLTGTYAVGAPAYANSSWYALPGGEQLAFDAAYDPATGDLDLATSYSVSAGLGVDIRNANLAIQGAWSRFESDTLGDLTGGTASANFTQYDLQAALTYMVVKDLTFGVSGEYQYLDHEDADIDVAQQLAMLFRVERWF